MVKLTVNNVEFPLAFTLDAMDAMEDATGQTLSEQRFSIGTKADRANVLKILHILAREGARLSGAPLADTYGAEWFRTYMKPGKLVEAVNAITDAIGEGMRMETEEPDEDAEVDLVLEEIKKNGAADG